MANLHLHDEVLHFTAKEKPAGFKVLANNNTRSHSRFSRVVRAVKTMGQQIARDSTLKFMAAVMTIVTAATIIGAFGMTLHVTNAITELQTHTDDGFSTINQRLDRNDRRFDRIETRLDGTGHQGG